MIKQDKTHVVLNLVFGVQSHAYVIFCSPNGKITGEQGQLQDFFFFFPLGGKGGARPTSSGAEKVIYHYILACQIKWWRGLTDFLTGPLTPV